MRKATRYRGSEENTRPPHPVTQVIAMVKTTGGTADTTYPLFSTVAACSSRHRAKQNGDGFLVLLQSHVEGSR